MAVVVNGNDWEGRGGDGLDTVFLVDADSVEQASEVVDQFLRSSSQDDPWSCSYIHILEPRKQAPGSGPLILSGPVYGVGWIYHEDRSFFRGDAGDAWSLT